MTESLLLTNIEHMLLNIATAFGRLCEKIIGRLCQFIFTDKDDVELCDSFCVMYIVAVMTETKSQHIDSYHSYRSGFLSFLPVLNCRLFRM